MKLENVDVPEAHGEFGSAKERRKVRLERTVGGSGPLFELGKLLTRLKNGKALAQCIAEGEEIESEALGVDFPLNPQFVLSLTSIETWGCPFCYSAHGSGVGVSRAVSADNLKKNIFYYNPNSQELFTISKNCLRGHSSLRERFREMPTRSETVNDGHLPLTGRTSLARKSFALVQAFCCGLGYLLESARRQ